MNLAGPRSYFKASGNPFVPELLTALTEGIEATVEYVKSDEYKQVRAKAAYVPTSALGIL